MMEEHRNGELLDENLCRVCLTPEIGCIRITSSMNPRHGRISDMITYCTGVEVSLTFHYKIINVSGFIKAICLFAFLFA